MQATATALKPTSNCRDPAEIASPLASAHPETNAAGHWRVRYQDVPPFQRVEMNSPSAVEESLMDETFWMKTS